MSAHTPGPWRVLEQEVEYELEIVTMQDSRAVASVPLDDQEGEMLDLQDQTQAVVNARLIAAAPDLLAELRKLADTCERLCSQAWMPDTTGAYAAIAKAEGKR